MIITYRGIISILVRIDSPNAVRIYCKKMFIAQPGKQRIGKIYYHIPNLS